MATHRSPHHEISMPAFHTPYAGTGELAVLPASTRTSYTRVDLTRPASPLSQISNDDSRSRPDHEGDGDDSAQEESAGGDGQDGEGVGVEQEQGQGAEGPEPEPVPVSPQASVTFLLVSGRRRTMVFEPETTVGRVKELVWNTWPNDWQDERPPAPSYLRILYLGKVLQDDDTLSHLAFTTHLPAPHSAPPAAAPPSTIVHLSIRAFAPPADDGVKKKRRLSHWGDGGGGADPAGDPAGEHAGGCCCIVC